MDGRVACVLLLVGLASPQPPAVLESLRTRVEYVHEHQTSLVHGVRLHQPDAVSHFFQARNFAPAWSDSAAREILQSIRSIDRDGLAPSDYHLAVLQSLLTSGGHGEGEAADLQILMTDAVAALIDHVRFGKVRPITLDSRWNVDPRQRAEPLERTLADLAAAPSVAARIEELKPSHFIYRGLKHALAGHRQIAGSGGWPIVPAGQTLKPGMSDPRVAIVRRRLTVTGELPSSSRGQEYNDELARAVRRFQERHRLTGDAAIGTATLRAMNATADERVDQLRVNLERARWVVGGLSDTFVLVNVPAFKAYLIRDRKNVWETRVVVGRAGRQTPTFRADLKYLVFNPDWIVPPTILANDVLAPMRKGDNAIARKKLSILDRQGRLVSPASIDWSRATASDFPYTLRQAPGADNALGRVKFVFPNEHTIFLHDTPSQELFAPDMRTFSSGCIRVERATEFAAVLLDGQGDWNASLIDEVIARGSTETVFLERPLPVLIVYWTASVNPAGELRYARDVYNLDTAVLRVLDRAGT